MTATSSTESKDLESTPSKITAILQRIARGAVQKKLSSMRYGFLCVRDDIGEWQAGHKSDNAVSVYVNDLSFYIDVMTGGSVGAARAFTQNKWDSSDLVLLFRLLIRNMDVIDGFESGAARLLNLTNRAVHYARRNTPLGSRRNVHEHYDLGNEFFATFLDETMTYSAGIFERDDSSLKDASIAKLDRVCRKLGLNKTDHVLEIGSGWGSFAIHAAAHYGCKVTTTTISNEQHELASKRVSDAGLSENIEIQKCDYRDLEGKYDKLVSIEMIEAVGHKYLPTYFAQCARLLKDDGQMLLQAITMPDKRYAQYLKAADFIQTFIFPGSCVPSLSAMLDAIKSNSDLSVGHVEDIGPNYAITLRHWLNAFKRNELAVSRLGYPESFIRMWEYYFCYCEAGFEERYLGDLQIMLNKPGCRKASFLTAIIR